jgi:hypothetical protein
MRNIWTALKWFRTGSIWTSMNLHISIKAGNDLLSNNQFCIKDLTPCNELQISYRPARKRASFPLGLELSVHILQFAIQVQ